MEQQAAELSLQDRLLTWFEVNKKSVAIAAVVVAVVGGSIGVYLWQQGVKRVKAGEALSQAFLSGSVAGGGGRVGADALLRVTEEHSGTQAGARALLQAGATLFAEGKFAEAQTQFSRFLRDYPANPFAYEARFGIAATLDAQGKADEAAKAYADLAAASPNSPLAAPARLAAARVYERENRLSEAAEIYEALSRDTQGGMYAAEAAFRLQQVRRKLPAPVEIPAAATAPATTNATPEN